MAINFSNPTPISDDQFADILSLDFSAPVKELSAKEESTPEEPNEPNEVVEPQEESDSKEEIKIDSDEENEESINPYTSLVNSLADKGILKEAYDGFDPEADADEEVLTKLIEYNTEKRVEEEMDEFFSSLSEETKRILNYDLNAKGKNIKEYLAVLLEEQSIKDLDISDPYDQERILREWYRNKEGFNQQEVNEKIETLRDAGILEKEAKMIKPKLDKAAEGIAIQKEEEQKALRELENRVREDFSSRLIDTIKTGKVGGINLTKEDAAKIHTVLTTDEIEVTTHGNKKVMMSPMEAIVFFNKYDKKGSLENLALATLLLLDPEKFDKEYSKKAQTEESAKFKTQAKYSNLNIKEDPARKVPDLKNAKPAVDPKKIKWNLKI